MFTYRKEYAHLGVVTEFKHSEKIGNLFRGHNQLRHMHNWGTGWSFLPSHESLVFIDNHDNQREHGKDHILTHRDRAQYVMATAFMLAHPYGITQVMSSFKFSDFEQGKSIGFLRDSSNFRLEIVLLIINFPFQLGRLTTERF